MNCVFFLFAVARHRRFRAKRPLARVSGRLHSPSETANAQVTCVVLVAHWPPPPLRHPLLWLLWTELRCREAGGAAPALIISHSIHHVALVRVSQQSFHLRLGHHPALVCVALLHRVLYRLVLQNHRHLLRPRPEDASRRNCLLASTLACVILHLGETQVGMLKLACRRIKRPVLVLEALFRRFDGVYAIIHCTVLHAAYFLFIIIIIILNREKFKSAYQEDLALSQTIPARLQCKSPCEPSGGNWGVDTGGTGPGSALLWPARSSSFGDGPQRWSHPASSPILADWREGCPALPLPPQQCLTKGWWWPRQKLQGLKRWWAGRSRSGSVPPHRVWRELPPGGRQQWFLPGNGR